MTELQMLDATKDPRILRLPCSLLWRGAHGVYFSVEDHFYFKKSSNGSVCLNVTRRGDSISFVSARAHGSCCSPIILLGEIQVVTARAIMKMLSHEKVCAFSALAETENEWAYVLKSHGSHKVVSLSESEKGASCGLEEMRKARKLRFGDALSFSIAGPGAGTAAIERHGQSIRYRAETIGAWPQEIFAIGSDCPQAVRAIAFVLASHRAHILEAPVSDGSTLRFALRRRGKNEAVPGNTPLWLA